MQEQQEFKFKTAVNEKFSEIAEQAGVNDIIKKLAHVGKSLLVRHHKVIADRAGWDVVEFLGDPLMTRKRRS